MIYKYLIIFLYVCTITYSAFGEIPSGLKVLLDKFYTESDMTYGFNDLRSYGYIDKSLNNIYLRIGTPIHVYYLDDEKLINSPDSVEVNTLIKPTKRWEIPIYGKGQGVCFVTARQKEESWYLAGANCCAMSKTWDEVRKAWPENSENNPILIEWGKIKMIHFQKKNKYNLTFLQGYGVHDSMITSIDYNTLGNSKKAFTYIKELIHKYKKFNAAHPLVVDPSGNTNGGKK